MSNDMTWEQKCRISALRAACASPYDHPTGISDESTDDIVTKRILTRAEAFRVALLSDDALDVQYDNVEALGLKSTPSPLNEQVYIGTCKHCLTSIQLFEPFNDAARWIDANGYSQCANKQSQEHEPELEPTVGAEPLGTHCPECGASTTRPNPLKLEDKSICRNQWHGKPTTLGEAFRTPISTHCPGCGSSSKDDQGTVQLTDRAGWEVCTHQWHNSDNNVCPSCSSSNREVRRIAGCNHKWHQE